MSCKLLDTKVKASLINKWMRSGKAFSLAGLAVYKQGAKTPQQLSILFETRFSSLPLISTFFYSYRLQLWKILSRAEIAPLMTFD